MSFQNKLFESDFDLNRNNLVTDNSMFVEDYKDCECIVFAMGCFWGAERKFWTESGVVSTAVGYAGGHSNNPTYQDVCTGMTGHAEGVLLLLDSKSYSLRSLLSVFWESHDPTQGMRQGNDVGTQYRSLIMCYSKEHKNLAIESKNIYQKHLSKNGFGEITTEIVDPSTFFYAEGYHQQYLHKNPGGYCGLKGTGVICQSS